jgi:hypothetical protein
MYRISRREFEVVVLSDGKWSIDDDNIDIQVSTKDGKKYSATLFTPKNVFTLMDRYKTSGECANGTFVWAVEMIILRDLSHESILSTVEELIRSGECTNKGQAFFVDQRLFLGYDVARWDD